MTANNRPPGEQRRTGRTEHPSALPSIGIDWDFYMQLLSESDAPDEQKRELIETLWNIVVAFVDLGFGVHPVQQAREQEAISKQIATMDLPAMLQSVSSPKGEFDRRSGHVKEPHLTGRGE